MSRPTTSPRRRGRPPTHEPLLGLDAAALGAIVGASAQMGARYLAGSADMGAVRLMRLIAWLKANRPDVASVDVLDDLASRLIARRDQGKTPAV